MTEFGRKKSMEIPDALSVKRRIHKEIMALDKDAPKRRNQIDLMRANIPREYRFLSFTSFKGDKKAGDFVKRYCDSLPDMLERGWGFILSGPNGVGKTMLMMLTLKAAVTLDYSAFYITLPEIFNLIYRSFDYPALTAELSEIVLDSQFLAIGEVGKDYHRKESEQWAISMFDTIFRTRRSKMLPTILDTNFTKAKLGDTYGESLMSLFDGCTLTINVTGEDYRRTVQQEEMRRVMAT